MKTLFSVSLATVLFTTSLLSYGSGGDIANFHGLPSKGGKVFRGAAPGQNMHQIRENDITHILIFKNDIRGEVEAEKKFMKDGGIVVKHIPFKWKDIDSSEKACGQAIDALNYVLDVSSNIENGILFHCTVGEDRTGLLAGLYRLATSKWTVDRTYRDEMCKYGFANGNKKKPENVVAPILNELYPVYRMAAAAIEESKNKREKPNKKYCRREAIANVKPVRCP